MATTAAATTVALSNNWQWCERDVTRDPLEQSNFVSNSTSDDLSSPNDNKYEWRDCAAFPSEIHVELMHAGIIPDPYLGFNEHEVQWVGEREWLYRTTFDYTGTNPFADLIFDGLDTFCTAYLNGRVILQAENQFTPYTVSLNPLQDLHPAGNILLLHFKSAKAIALELEKKYGRVRAGSVNLGHPSRVYVRKAQYDWRWDWGPELMTVGPYLPISIKSYVAAIENIYPRTSVSTTSLPHPSGNPPTTLKLQLSISGRKDDVAKISVSVIESNESKSAFIKEAEVEPKDVEGFCDPKNLTFDVLEWSFSEGEIDLWWPVGYGHQTLYTVNVTLKDKDGNLLDSQHKKVGFRTTELIQRPYDPQNGNHSVLDRYHHGEGTSFFFQINSVPMFMGGSNWIPADNFFTTIKPERYRAWLQLLKDGNQNMIRVWGGGIYEVGTFYDLCDELGILVWQDFQFACGVYPAHKEFVESVKLEAEANVTRLRHHPSIVLWCGNNEDYQQVLQWGGIDDLPARLIYEHVLPEVVERLTDPSVPYHRGSPYGGKGWDTSDPTIGDIHQWEVWAGNEPFYQNYDERGGRFVSEFGMPAFPDRRTIEYWLEDAKTSEAEKKKLRYAQSKSIQQHNKAGSHERRFAILMNENFRITSNLDEHLYNTQLLQSEALGYAYRVWRREWRGTGREYAAGAIVWQLNDCWPVISWAIADYFLRPKPAWYSIKRELATITVGMQRTVTKSRAHDRPKQFYEFGAFQSTGASLDVWGTNSGLETQRVIVELEFFDLNSDWKSVHSMPTPIELAPNSSTEILAGFNIPEPIVPGHAESELNQAVTRTYSVVAVARLRDARSGDHTILARTSDWPQPYRLLDLPEPGHQAVDVTVSIAQAKNEVSTVHLTARIRPVKGVVLIVDPAEQNEDEVQWSDNAIDLVPGDEQIIFAKGLKTDRVKLRYLNGSQ